MTINDHKLPTSKTMIGVIPLDDRPCCYKFPYRISAIAGHQILQPPVTELGRFTTPGHCDELKRWLLAHAGEFAGIVIAIDQLAYGGLIASRTMDRSLEQCMETLSVIPEIKRMYPNLKIYAANVLMRLSITYKNKEYYEYGMKIFKYSQLYDRVHRLGESDQAVELEQLRQSIPAPVLNEYLEARKRNHAVNQLMLDWCEQGIIDFAAITQEDASPIGMHLSEQRILMEQIYTKHIQRKAMVYPGADEAVHTLLARMMQVLAGKQMRIYPRYASTAGRLMIADFEDRPVEETVNCHIAAAGGIRVEHADEADLVLFVNTPVPGARIGSDKAFFNSRHNYWDIVEGMKHELSQERQVALADVAICNASDLELVQYVLEEGLYLKLAAYAGWNTAGNTLGTVLGHAIARWLSGDAAVRSLEQEKEHYTFMMERLMDEWAYQAQVRGVVNEWIASSLDVNPNDLEYRYDEVNERIKPMMTDKFEQLRSILLNGWTAEFGKLELKDVQLIDVHLPWNRTFEVYVETYCDVQRT